MKKNVLRERERGISIWQKKQQSSGVLYGERIFKGLFGLTEKKVTTIVSIKLRELWFCFFPSFRIMIG